MPDGPAVAIPPPYMALDDGYRHGRGAILIGGLGLRYGRRRRETALGAVRTQSTGSERCPLSIHFSFRTGIAVQRNGRATLSRRTSTARETLAVSLVLHPRPAGVKVYQTGVSMPIGMTERRRRGLSGSAMGTGVIAWGTTATASSLSLSPPAVSPSPMTFVRCRRM
jgi:hypothetical protein